jgi:hypothetical protein
LAILENVNLHGALFSQIVLQIVMQIWQLKNRSQIREICAIKFSIARFLYSVSQIDVDLSLKSGRSMACATSRFAPCEKRGKFWSTLNFSSILSKNLSRNTNSLMKE